jgi:hypothetical protein
MSTPLCTFVDEDGDTVTAWNDPKLMPRDGRVSLFQAENLVLSSDGQIKTVDASGKVLCVHEDAAALLPRNSLSLGES